ncbi:FG-GAP repeat domain-containing protein [Streptomyces sp. NPDC059534]|uniref:FG-GAP repeat domain-containing protein n=1 Tax=Streptomyces sp. NPDC059534 TaxID=3346859 RepID=UPI0036B297FD
MTRSRPARRQLTAAVITVLAITAGTAFTTVPATAAPVPGTVSAAPAADTQPGYNVPADVNVVSWGRSGFLGSSWRSLYPEGEITEYRWYRPDGTSTHLARSYGDIVMTPDLAVSDVVTKTSYHSDGEVVELRDMSAPAGTAPVVFDLRKPGSTYKYVATAGSTILVKAGPPNGPKELRLLSRSGSGFSERKITGVPATFGDAVSVTGAPGTAVVSYIPVGSDWTKTAAVVIDLPAGAVTRTYPPLTSGTSGYGRRAVSPTKLAVWQDANLVVTDRATGTDTMIAVGQAENYSVLDLLGDWIAYGKSTEPGGGTAGDPLVPFTARSLTDGRTVTLLDHASWITHGPDDTLLVQGATAGKGEGVYRIALGGDGTPTAELVFSTRKSTPLSILSTDFDPVVDLDAQRNRLHMDWSLTHSDFSYTLELVHKETGERFVHTGRNDPYSFGRLAFVWDAASAPAGSNTADDPFNGDYTWNLTVKPDGGVGPDVHATGALKVVRKPTMHDFNDNGSPDVLFRDSLGYLRATDTTYDTRTKKVVPTHTHETMGWDWGRYKLIESVGDIAGTNAPDVVARDAAGVLWLHQGTGGEEKPAAARVRISAGWNIYHQLAGGSDVTGDGRADVLATDTAGVMWLYKGTGKATAPLANRVRIGGGWNIYNQITAVGDIAGAPAGDFVARDKAGVLWLYLGKGNGTFATRSRIGAGWNAYSQLVGIGDATGDGRADLYAYGPHNTSYVYAGTGRPSSPVEGRRPTDLLLNTEAPVNHVT